MGISVKTALRDAAIGFQFRDTDAIGGYMPQFDFHFLCLMKFKSIHNPLRHMRVY
jgi:hypothetical protein